MTPRRSEGRGGGDVSNHTLTIALHDKGGAVKSTRLERNGPLKVEMPNRGRTGRSAMIEA